VSLAANEAGLTAVLFLLLIFMLSVKKTVNLKLENNEFRFRKKFNGNCLKTAKSLKVQNEDSTMQTIAFK